MDKYEILHQPFDIETHKQHFTHYLEVMLAPDGSIHYAVPSHQEFLIKQVMRRRHCTREELDDACPPEFYFDYLNWLIPESGGYVPVWENFVYDYPLNTQQRSALCRLKEADLYFGDIPKT